MDSIIASAPKYLSGFEKIYVSRRKQAISRPGLRVLENETELVERLRALGFNEVFPEEMSIADQVAMFSSAKIIVGPGGSNMFGCVFARTAELILDIESGPAWLHGHMNLLSSIRRPFSIVMGVQNGRGGSVHRNWTVDVDCLLQGLRRMGV
jgi:capsular polysaccharide biosynthesis protein